MKRRNFLFLILGALIGLFIATIDKADYSYKLWVELTNGNTLNPYTGTGICGSPTGGVN